MYRVNCKPRFIIVLTLLHTPFSKLIRLYITDIKLGVARETFMIIRAVYFQVGNPLVVDCGPREMCT